MKISAITNGISQDYETACQLMNETGVKYAELQEAYGKRVEYLTLDDARKIKALNDQYDIEVASVTTHAFVGIGVGGIEVGDEKYQEQMALLKNGIEIAKIVGAKHVRAMCFARQIVMWGKNGADQWNAGGNKAWPKFIELYRPIAKLAEEEGISLIVENGFNGMLTSAYTARRFIEDLGSPNVSVLWDPANAAWVGDIAYPNGYEEVKNCLGHVHIKDMLLDPIRSTAEVVAIGRGDLAPYLTRIAKALRDDGYDGFVSLENIYRPEGKDYVDGYRIDIETLKEIFA